jgi:hypothetical protein
MASVFTGYIWYWDVTDMLHGTYVYSSKAERFVPVSDSNYTAWLAADGGNTPTAITSNGLAQYMGYMARQTFVLKSGAYTISADTRIYNPTFNYIQLNTAAGPIYKVIMPSALSPIGIPIGVPITFYNFASSGGGATVNIYADDGTTLLAVLDPGIYISFVLTDNSPVSGNVNGTWRIRFVGDVSVATGITPNANDFAQWAGSTTIKNITPAAALTAIGAQPLDADLTAIAALTGINTIYYRSAANTWAAVTVGTGLSFSSGTLASTVTGDVTQAGNNTFTGQNYFTNITNLPMVVGHTARITTALALEVNGIAGKDGIADTRWSADAVGGQLLVRKSRGASVGSNVVVNSGDTLGKISFAGNTGSAFQAGGPGISGVCNSAPFGTNTPGFILVEAVTIGGVLTTAATFKDTGSAILGTNTNDDAAAGFVGEYKETVVASGSAVVISNNIWTAVISLSLTAGDWDVTTDGMVWTVTASPGAFSYQANISTTSAANAVDLGNTGFSGSQSYWTLHLGPRRINLSAATTVYLNVFHNTGQSDTKWFGRLSARRVR